MVIYSNEGLKPEVMRMWKACFDDTDEFMEMYFRRKYRNENTLIKIVDGKIVSSLQMLPYRIVFGNEQLWAAYISGASTFPEEQKKGYMQELLIASYEKMYERKIAITLLVPQEDWLIEFYAKYGYVSMFDVARRNICLPDASTSDIRVKEATLQDVEAVSRFYAEVMQKKQLIVLKTTADWEAIFEDWLLSNGKIFIAENDARLLGVCFTSLTNGKLYLKGLQTANHPTRTALLSCIRNHCQMQHAILISPSDSHAAKPFGMARIVDVEYMLRLYAAAHPEMNFSIRITDSQATWNNGCFRVGNGLCQSVKCTNTDFDVSIQLFTQLIVGYRIQSLSAQYSIFAKEKPEMTFMME